MHCWEDQKRGEIDKLRHIIFEMVSGDGYKAQVGAWPLTAAGRQNAYKGSVQLERNRKYELGCQSVGEDSGQTKSHDCYVS